MGELMINSTIVISDLWTINGWVIDDWFMMVNEQWLVDEP